MDELITHICKVSGYRLKIDHYSGIWTVTAVSPGIRPWEYRRSAIELVDALRALVALLG